MYEDVKTSETISIRDQALALGVTHPRVTTRMKTDTRAFLASCHRFPELMAAMQAAGSLVPIQHRLPSLPSPPPTGFMERGCLCGRVDHAWIPNGSSKRREACACDDVDVVHVRTYFGIGNPGYNVCIMERASEGLHHIIANGPRPDGMGDDPARPGRDEDYSFRRGPGLRRVWLGEGLSA